MQALQINPVQGPQCDRETDLHNSGDCYHDSCQEIDRNGRVVLVEGPLCQRKNYEGICGHGYCAMRDSDQMFCGQHGWQLIEESGSGVGFAGGRVHYTLLVCGCMDMDESDDIRASY